MADLDLDDLLNATAETLQQFNDDPEVVAAKLDLAERAAEYARSIAPEDTGAYKESIGVYRDGDTIGVIFADEAAAAIEYGTDRTPEYAVRARTEEHFNSMP